MGSGPGGDWAACTEPGRGDGMGWDGMGWDGMGWDGMAATHHEPSIALFNAWMIGNGAKLLVDIWQGQAQRGEQPGSYDSNCLCCSAAVSRGGGRLSCCHGPISPIPLPQAVAFPHGTYRWAAALPWRGPPTRGTSPSPIAELGCWMML